MFFNRKSGFLLLLFLLSSFLLNAQTKRLAGVIKDKQSDEPIPFASVVFKLSKKGALTDSAGRFSLDYEAVFANDSLLVQSVGYKALVLPISAFRDSATIIFKIEVLPPSGEAVVKSKYNRALWFWKKIMANKDKNNRTRWDSYSYEIYNKLEMDLNNIKKEKLAKNIILKPLGFVLSYVDSAEGSRPYLPVYLSETLSDYYYQKNPERIHEVIKATKTNGVENESLIKEMGGMYQNVNVYNNFIPVFNKDFISPFNSNGDNYYKFKLADTAYLRGKRLVHFRFSAKRKGENTFEGDCWVNDTSFAIQKVTMRPSPDANINFIEGLSIIQEYRLINDSIWFLYKDRFVADIAPIGNGKLGIKGRKTATYEHVVLNDTATTQDIAKTKKNQQVDLVPNTQDLPDSFWQKNRHEGLDKNELTVYKVLDTLTKNKTYIFYRDAVEAIMKGTKDIGNIRIGPWYYWMSGNYWEGARFRFDVSTNRGFHKKLFLSAYTAYGTKDHQFKGGGEVKYLFNKDYWTYLRVLYKNDLDNGQVNYDQLGTDNLFATLFRRPNIPYKFQRLERKEIEFYKESPKGFGVGITLVNKKYDPLLNLPGKEFYTQNGAEPFNTFESVLHLRYAHLERSLISNFSRISLGSLYPILDLKYTRGWANVLSGNYDYHKVDATITHYFKVSPYGQIKYNFFGGKVFGTLPYQMLDILPGSEVYYYNRYAFNLMQRFEYLADQYAGFNVEHNFGPGIFKYNTLTRKLKFRQFWSAKGVVGTLSEANKQMNFVGNYPYRSLDGKPYIELGTGVDNIFKFFRIDFVWRVASPPPISGELRDKFGMFASFRFQF
ncbi:MAG: DUF5686 and carboxypeptidase regulatory-like domain-containing protein [Chitinophagaceae bacterium]|nr:DUF5686 and carboxypeptidase regulatory-like domain-containing protein [Chitinophagaceae bacterium]